MKVWKYPKEVYDFVAANARTMTDQEIADALNGKYAYDMTVSKVRAFRKNRGIKTGRKGGVPKGYSYKYPDGLEEFVRKNAQGKKTKELADLINAHFGAGTITENQTRYYKKNHKITSGLDCRFKKGVPSKTKGIHREMPVAAVAHQFPKGHKPSNYKEKGTISKTTDGYLIIKVSNTGTQRERWKPLHHYIWEQKNGEIPQGKMLTFLDGDKGNCSIENLALIDNNINLELQRRKLRSQCAEFTKAGIKVAELAQAVKNRKQERG